MISRSAKPVNDESETVQAAANTQNLWHFIFVAVCCKNSVIIVMIGIAVIVIIY